MHNLSANPIKINLGFSIWLTSYLLLTHVSALLLLLFLDIGLFLYITLTSLTVLSLIYHWRQDLPNLCANSVIGIDWSADRGWLIRLKDGSKIKGLLCQSSFVSRFILLLNFKTADHARRRVAVASDAIDGEQFRRLRVLLRMGNHFGV